MSFRCIDLFDVSGMDSSLTLNELLSKDETPREFNMLFSHDSLITTLHNKNSPSFESLKILTKSRRALLLSELTENQDFHLRSDTTYLLGGFLFDGFQEKICLFLRILRKALADAEISEGICLSQATVFDLAADRNAQSPLYSGTLNYMEYLLWDDGDLWGKEAWKKQAASLIEKNPHLSEGAAALRLAWQGAGWMSSQLAMRCQSSDDSWPNPVDIETWAEAARASLVRYDHALIKYFLGEKHSSPPGHNDWNNYVRTLCDFLPPHKSRKGQDWLASTNSGDPGGPRLWSGILDEGIHMYLRHLLLDGWLTLWPVDDDGGTKFYLQPGSLALLYWAARRADMPYSRTPEQFLRNYDWSDPHWFGGQWRIVRSDPNNINSALKLKGAIEADVPNPPIKKSPSMNRI